VGDYVLAGYGTGAVMAVPGGDQRDWRFAKHFGLPIIAVTEGADIDKEADERKDATICSEGFLQGLKVPEAIRRAIDELEKLGAGEGKVNFRLRDAAFGRQRYWGEPIPIYYEDDIPRPVDVADLPVRLPEIDKYQPTETGEPPLARAKDWTYRGFPLETTTMPGWAGSSWYFLRYMDPGNTERFASEEAVKYWGPVDLYIGGSEHATGHLLYFRFWTKFLYDRGWLPFDEPARKLVNQGMIQGKSAHIYRLLFTSFSSGEDETFEIDEREGRVPGPSMFISSSLKNAWYSGDKAAREQIERGLDEHQEKLRQKFPEAGLSLSISDSPFGYTQSILVDIGGLNEHDGLDLNVIEASNSDFVGATFTGFTGHEDVSREVEKMSKSKLNVVNPDDI
ncbi:MAG: leucine--tRNA ligase, partial [Flavobacteriales bacterium]|nr:leucine--tRNA ligase [Flavobacteriales bacterium]